MGLTIHYTIRSATKSSRQAAVLVRRMRELALDLPFDSVSEIRHLTRDECATEQVTHRSEGLTFLVSQATLPVRIPWATKRINRDFGTEQICTRYAEAAPLEMLVFVVTPGPGCEMARFGLARYPREVEVTYNPAEDVRFLDDELSFDELKWRRYLLRQGRSHDDRPDGDIEIRRLPMRLAGWRWGSFCKTQYASDPKCGGSANFLRCHVGLITLLDRVAALGGVSVRVDDEGKYGGHSSRVDSSANKSVWRIVPGSHDPRALLEEVGHWNEMIAASAGALKDALGTNIIASILAYADFERLEFKGREKLDIDSFLETMKQLAEHRDDPQP